MLVIVWEYAVKPERIEDFESVYRPDGAWDALFRGAPGFVSVTLMKDVKQPGRYMVADRWTSATFYESFIESHRSAYEALSARGQRLFERETELGRFDFVD